MDKPIRWTEKFFEVEKMKDENGNEIPWNPPLNKAGFWQKPETDTASELKDVIKNKHTAKFRS